MQQSHLERYVLVHALKYEQEVQCSLGEQWP